MYYSNIIYSAINTVIRRVTLASNESCYSESFDLTNQFKNSRMDTFITNFAYNDFFCIYVLFRS